MTNKKKVLKLFKTNKVLYFSDISVLLNMDLEKVVNICQELLDERKIRVSLGKKTKKK